MTPTRRSERLKAKPPLKTNDAASFKRRAVDAHLNRKDPKNFKKQRIDDPNNGKLEGVLSKFPLDVLYEVLSYLHPLDLLHISRSAKMFRNALFTKSSVYVWANAFDSIGLDSRSILEDLNQPQLARLLFERRCSNCNGSGPKRVIWEARIRLCKGCISGLEIMQPANTEPVQSTEENKHRIPLIYAITPKDPKEQELYLVTSIGRHYQPRYSIVYHAATFRLLWEESSSMSEEEFEKWYAGEKEYYEELEDEARQLHEFAVSYDQEIAYEKQQRWQKRYESVIERLKAEGFEKELKAKYSWVRSRLQRHRDLWFGGPLTDEEWSELRESYMSIARLEPKVFP